MGTPEREREIEIDTTDVGTKIKQQTVESILEQQASFSQMIEPPAAITAMLRQTERIRAIVEPPALLTEFVQQEEYIRSEFLSSAIEAIDVQQGFLVEHELAFSKAIDASIQINDLTGSELPIAISDTFAAQAPIYDLAANMGNALDACLPKYDDMALNLFHALEAAMPKLNVISEMAVKLIDSLPDIRRSISSIAQQVASAIDSVLAAMQSGLSELANSLANFQPVNVEQLFRSFSHIRDVREKNELLKKYGWYLISELPCEIVDVIYERQSEITQEEVDALIVAHFRKDRCNELKKIVKSWHSLPYFSSRTTVFHEAQVCHSRRLFNASTTMVSLQFEGVITDFVRDRIMKPTYRQWAEKALQCVNDMTNELTFDVMPFEDWIICAYVLECVEQIFTTNFSPEDPESCPNNSRHKIAHGQAKEKETEANSLRRFLFMNELFKLFSRLEVAHQIAS